MDEGAYLWVRPWVVLVWVLAGMTSCGGGDGPGGNGSITPSGDWEQVGYHRGCIAPASLSLDDQERPVLVCMYEQSVNPPKVPMISTWTGTEFQTEPMVFLSPTDTPTACPRMFPRGARGPRVACATVGGLFIAEPDGLAGQWSAPDRPASPGQELLRLKRWGWGWGALALMRDSDGLVYVRGWHGTSQSDGIFRWWESAPLSSSQVGAADAVAAHEGWHAAYADGEQGGRLRLELFDGTDYFDYPNLTTEAVDLVRVQANTVLYTNQYLAVVYREVGGALKTMGGSNGALGPVLDITSADVGEVDLFVSSANGATHVIYTDLDAGGVLMYTTPGGTPLPMSAGAASGISLAAEPALVSFCDETQSPPRAQVTMHDGNDLVDLELPLLDECLETHVIRGFEDLMVAVLTSTADGRVVRIMKHDRDDGWLDWGSIPVSDDARNLSLIWADMGLSGQTPDPVIVGWQGAVDTGVDAEPLVSHFGTGAYRYTAHVATDSRATMALGPEGRIYVASQFDYGVEDGTLRVHRVEPDGSWTSFGIAMDVDESWSDPVLAVGPDGAPVIAVSTLGTDAEGTLVKRWEDAGTGDATWVVVGQGESHTPAGMVVPSDGRIVMAGTLYIPPPDEPGGISNYELVVFREAADGGDWQDLGRPDFWYGYRRHAVALALVDDEVMVVYSEYADPYNNHYLHSRWHPGRGWEEAQPVLNLGDRTFSYVQVGSPLVVQASDGTTYLHMHNSDSTGPLLDTTDYVARWVPR